LFYQEGGVDDKSIHTSVDPAPPLEETDTEKLKAALLDESLPLFHRYRAMFSLRNKVMAPSIPVF
jgi:deoxyhypusine monooxygenase